MIKGAPAGLGDSNEWHRSVYRGTSPCQARSLAWTWEEIQWLEYDGCYASLCRFSNAITGPYQLHAIGFGSLVPKVMFDKGAPSERRNCKMEYKFSMKSPQTARNDLSTDVSRALLRVIIEDHTINTINPGKESRYPRHKWHSYSNQTVSTFSSWIWTAPVFLNGSYISPRRQLRVRPFT